MPLPLHLSRRPAAAVNVVLGVVVLAGAWWAYQVVAGPAATPAAAAVRTVEVTQGTVTASVTAAGTLESAATATASFVTGGTVTGIEVKVGQHVRKSQILARVDATDANRTLDAARADLTAARDSVTRASTAGTDTSAADNAVTQAELAVDAAEDAVAGTVLRAPMAGTVVAVNGTIGSSSGGSSAGGGSQGGGSQGGGAQGGGAQGGGTQGATSASSSATGFIDLADLGRLQVRAAVPEADATRLREKQAATVTWNALSGATADATVAAVDPQASTANNVVTYGVTLLIGKLPAGAKPGQTVSVTVVTGTADNAVSVNSAAVTTVGDRHSVNVLVNGQPQRRAIEIGLQGDRSTQVTSGLTVGEQVVLPTTTTGTGTQGGFPGGGRFPGGGGFPGAGGLNGGGFTGGGGRQGGGR